MLYDTFVHIEQLQGVQTFTESLFAYPLVQGVHVLALAFAVGLLAVADLRLAGVLLQQHPERAVLGGLRPWFIGGFTVLFITGVLLFLPKATLLYASPLFWVKMFLILLAGINALYFEFNYRRARIPGGAAAWYWLAPRTAGLVSLSLWTLIVVLGRLLAYF